MERKKVHLSIWSDYLEFAIILIPKEFQFGPLLHPRSEKSEFSFSQILPRFPSFRYEFICCLPEISSLFLPRTASELRDLHLFHLAYLSFSFFFFYHGEIYQVCHVQPNNWRWEGRSLCEELRRKRSRRWKINVTISAKVWKEDVECSTWIWRGKCCGVENKYFSRMFQMKGKIYIKKRSKVLTYLY